MVLIAAVPCGSEKLEFIGVTHMRNPVPVGASQRKVLRRPLPLDFNRFRCQSGCSLCRLRGTKQTAVCVGLMQGSALFTEQEYTARDVLLEAR
jgi:hypothetical protein